MISEMGYEPIFLIVEDILNQARKLGIPTSSRGSAASSLVAHCLDITSPDPIALNLYFERFLNPARKKPPDIDTDIASHRREEVIQYVFDKYGKDRVAMVGTINRYRPKSSLGDAAKAHGLSPDTIRQLTKKVPSSFFFRRGIDDDDPFETLLRNPTIPILKDIIKDARAIMDIPRHLSVHPGGIIIAPFPITDLVPLVHSSSLGINHAQYDLEGIEKFGLVKIDLLGVRGLSVLGEVADRVHSWHISEYNNPLDVLKKVPANDQATSKTVCDARTIGCFQIESPGMRATLQEINAKSIEDIMAALALYRPGPLRGGLRDAFVRRFRGEEPVTHIHESLSKLLENTMGVILYQEQVLQIAHELGGLTLAQADILRRAMSHFDPGGVMETLRKNFIDGAAQRRNVPPETANRIWEMMAAFAGYGFPKAHAASYARLAWNSAWCKTHYPAEFMSAVLGIGGGYYSQRVYLMEARRLGLQVNPPTLTIPITISA
jgi:DNA-directed DNA polymerase III PolC